MISKLYLWTLPVYKSVFYSVMLWKLKIIFFIILLPNLPWIRIPETDTLKANFQSEFTQKTFILLLLTAAIRNKRRKDTCHHLTFHLEICLTDCKWCVKLLWTALNSHETELFFYLWLWSPNSRNDILSFEFQCVNSRNDIVTKS